MTEPSALDEEAELLGTKTEESAWVRSALDEEAEQVQGEV